MNDGMRYWSVDLPGLDEAGAEKVAGSRYRGVVGAAALDPRTYLTLHLDVESVRHVVDFARRHDRDEVVDAIVQEFESWLSYSEAAVQPDG